MMNTALYSLSHYFKSICFVSQRLGRTAIRDCSDTTLWDLTTTSPHTGTASVSELACFKRCAGQSHVQSAALTIETIFAFLPCYG